MSDTVVSVRMPRSLILELKRLSREHHYLDVSEEVRSIVRKKYLDAVGGLSHAEK